MADSQERSATPHSHDAGTSASGPADVLRPRGRWRRSLLKGAAAVTGGVVTAAYTPPRLRSLGAPVALALSGPPDPPPPRPLAPVQGSPGFWKDNGKGQVSLWDTSGDLDWAAWATKLGLTSATASNPFVKTDLFTSVFASHADLAGLTMQQVIDGPSGATAAQKAARALIASYLNASLYGPGYPYTTAQLKALWQQAVSTNTKAAFDDLKSLLEATYT